MAIVRPYNEASTYFYDLNTFITLKKYDGHNGIIGASTNCFYEHYSKNKTLYCYKNDGELLKQIQTNALTNVDACWSSICIINEKMLITDHRSSLTTIF